MFKCAHISDVHFRSLKRHDEYKTVFSSLFEKLKEVFTMSRCDGGEGSVLYIRNIKTGETQLAKSKSAIYKLKRMFRQRWLASPITIYQKLIQRIVETADYHLLNTQTAIEIAKKLFQFGLWLVENNFPCGILDFQPVKSVRGEIPAGFSVYWEKFIKDTGIEDISLNPDNFGDFDKDIFSNSEELKVFSKNSNTNKPIVIFFQDIQGGGKSTIAHKLERIDVIEQDICYGCTKTTQFKLLQKIKSGKNVIVSRCNVNSKQYDAYLKIAFDNDCRILFLSTENADSELRLSVALAGVINRSSKGDNVMVGRLEYPFDEAVKFTTANWTSFKYHPKVIKIKTFRMDQKLRIEAENAYKNNSIKTFVENKKDILMSLREPLNKIVFEIQNIVDNPPKESFIRKGLEDTSYISFNLLDNSKLIEFVKEHCNIQGKTLYCQHITQVFLGKKTKTTIEVSESGESCIVETDALVINKKNGSAAFRVVNLQSSEGKMIFVESGVPHITALVSADSKPVDSVKFVKKTDDSVEVIPFNNTFETICVWN